MLFKLSERRDNVNKQLIYVEQITARVRVATSC